MSYADLYPVSSVYSRGRADDGPVSITVGGLWEEDELVAAGPRDEHKEWVIHPGPQAAYDDRAGAHEGPSAVTESGWTDMDWEMADHEPPQAASLVICLDTNTLIRHLALIKSVHTLLLDQSKAASTAPKTTFLIPTVVVQELDGLKQSSQRVQSTTSASSPSVHASTVGRLAQQANHWLLEQTRQERVDGLGRGVVFVRSPSDEGLTSNDDRILQTALAVRASLASSSSRPAPPVVMWTGDVNFSLKCEADGVETFGSGSRPVPRTPVGVLQMLGIFPVEDMPPVQQRPHEPHFYPTAPHPPSQDELADERMDLDDCVEMGNGWDATVTGSTDNPTRAVFLHLLSGCVPSALDRHLTKIRQEEPGMLDKAGLPSDPPPRTWRLDQCFDALARVWGNEKGRWEGRDLGAFVDRRNPTSTSTPSTATRSNQSNHARPSLHAPPPTPTVLPPPSPKHVREQLLPGLVRFFGLERAAVAPTEEESVEALKGIEIVLGGPGGRRFLGTQSWEEVKATVEKAWKGVMGLQSRGL